MSEHKTDKFKRDTSNPGVLLSNDFSTYQKRKKILEEQDKKNNEINSMKSELSELREQLSKLLEKDNT
tara:strand:- start:1493 stop:1696 length:204 start_codon:yes stop_codon:yes gene_type:complete